jgi:hypothetical protein
MSRVSWLVGLATPLALVMLGCRGASPPPPAHARTSEGVVASTSAAAHRERARTEEPTTPVPTAITSSIRAPYVDVAAAWPASPARPQGTVVAVTSSRDEPGDGPGTAVLVLEGDVHRGEWIRHRSLPMPAGVLGAVVAVAGGHVFVAVALDGIEKPAVSMLYELDSSFRTVASRVLSRTPGGRLHSSLALAAHPRFVVVSENEEGAADGGALVQTFAHGTLAPLGRARVGGVHAIATSPPRHLVVHVDDVYILGEHFPARNERSGGGRRMFAYEEYAVSRHHLPELRRVAAVDLGTYADEDATIAVTGREIEIASWDRLDRIAPSLDAATHRTSPAAPEASTFPVAGRFRTDCEEAHHADGHALHCTGVWSGDAPAFACLAHPEDDDAERLASVWLRRLEDDVRARCVEGSRGRDASVE